MTLCLLMCLIVPNDDICVFIFPYSCVTDVLCEYILTPCFLSCLAWPCDCEIAVSTGYRVSSLSQVEPALIVSLGKKS